MIVCNLCKRMNDNMLNKKWGLELIMRVMMIYKDIGW